MNKAFFAVTRVGLEAVVLFFVLSGFLVGGASIRKALRGEFFAGRYFIDRFARIYVPFVPALALTIGLLIWFGIPFSWAEAGLNLASLQGAFAQPFSGNTALWSLSYEVWFYIACGAGLGVLQPGFLGRRLAFVILLALSGIVFAKLMLAYVAAWLIGAAASFLTSPPSWLLWISGLLIAGAGIVLMQLTSISVQVNLQSFQWINRSVAVITLASGLGCIVAACSRIRLASPRFAGLGVLCATLASFSYTLYLIHNPFILALDQVGMLPKYAQLNISTVAIFWATNASIIAVAYLFYLPFEHNTGSLRRFLYRTLLPKPPEPLVPV